MAEPNDSVLVDCRDLSFGYGERRILDGVSFTVPRGKVTALMGASGGGKTTVLRLIGGQVRAQSGQLLFEGQDVARLDAAGLYAMRRRMGMLFQFGALFTDMSVFDNVAFPLRRHTRLSDAEVRLRVLECLARVGLSGAERRRPVELSVGMRRRAGFARAIALEPDILLFDEPTAGLDPMLISVIDEVISDLARRPGTTTVMVTHDLVSAKRVGTRAALLFHGKVVADAPVDLFFQLPDPAVRQFIEGKTEGPLLSPEDLIHRETRP